MASSLILNTASQGRYSYRYFASEKTRAQRSEVPSLSRSPTDKVGPGPHMGVSASRLSAPFCAAAKISRPALISTHENAQCNHFLEGTPLYTLSCLFTIC
jgi:hypothetical protein